MRGKEKCKALKELRQRTAEVNNIEYAVSECRHQGDCSGTCPKCEEELLYLERELEKRKKLGKTVVLAGLSACLVGVVSGCDSDGEERPWSNWNFGIFGNEPLEGDVQQVQPSIEEEYEGMEIEYESEYSTTETSVLDGDVAPIDQIEQTEDDTTLE